MTEILFVVLAMFGVIALMLLVIFGMKKIMNRLSGGRAVRGMSVVSAVGVGQDKSVMAVRAGRKNLLIGVTQTGISLLCELDDEDMEIIESSGAASDGNNEDMAGKSFAECFRYNLSRLGGEFISPYEKKKDDENDEAKD